MNFIMFSGPCVRAPRFSDGGKTPVLGFTVMSTRRWRDKEFKTYADCSVFGDKAKELNGTFGEGSYLQIQGEAGARTYESKGEHKAALTINALSVEVVGASPKQATFVPPPGSPAASGSAGETGDDIPF